MSGWIKLHRQLLEWEWQQDSHMVHLYIHMLLKANREPKRWKGVMVEAGQFIGSRDSLSFSTGISVRSIRTCLERLKECGLLTSKATNKYTIFTLVKWGLHANGEGDSDQQTVQQVTSKRPANDQQTTTNKKDKKVENTKKEKKSYPYDEVVALYHKHCPSLKRVRGLSDQRKELISYRFKQGCTLEDFALAFKGAECNPHNRGENDRKWQAGIDYVLSNRKNRDIFLESQENAPIDLPTEPEPAVEYFEPIGWQEFAKDYMESVRNQIFNEGEGKWENLTPAQKQDLTEKCKEL